MTTARNRTQAAVDELAAAIARGAYPPGTALPSEAELGARFSLSRMTVRVILSRLEQRGLIFRHHGKGTFVAERKPDAAHTVAVLLKDLSKASSLFLAEILGGLGAVLAARGMAVSLVGTDPAAWGEGLSSLAGVVVIPNHVTRSEIVALRGMRLPYVMAMDSDLPGPTVWMDVAKAARALAAGLLRLGHRRFALISGHREHADHHKRQGIGAALARAGIEMADVPDFETDYRPGAADEAARAILALRSRPTAVICFDDTLALRMMAAAREAGLDVPADLSIVGFNDAVFAALVEPPLSTVRFPASEAGAAAARAILAVVDGGRAVARERLGHTVLWRGSTAAPAAGSGATYHAARAAARIGS